MANEYPTPTYSGPPFLKLLDLEPDYLVDEYVYQDGGADRLLWADSPVLRWQLEYDGLTTTQAQVLDDHFAWAKGEFSGFTFVHPRGGTYTSVHYKEYKREHTKLNVQKRSVTLIKRP